MVYGLYYDGWWYSLQVRFYVATFFLFLTPFCRFLKPSWVTYINKSLSADRKSQGAVSTCPFNNFTNFLIWRPFCSLQGQKKDISRPWKSPKTLPISISPDRNKCHKNHFKSRQERLGMWSELKDYLKSRRPYLHRPKKGRKAERPV